MEEISPHNLGRFTKPSLFRTNQFVESQQARGECRAHFQRNHHCRVPRVASAGVLMLVLFNNEIPNMNIR